MDPAEIPYDNNAEGYISKLGYENLLIYSDCSTKESCDSSWDGDYFNEDDFAQFKDVTRSKKFYFKKKELDEARCIELEDVFMERTAEEEEQSNKNEEEVIQVVWSEDEPIQSKLVRFVEVLDTKKSNSKFTLSMLNEDCGETEIDSSEGEEIRGRFLEVKDSLEVLATSSRSLQGSKLSDWDFTSEEGQEVNRIWRKCDSQWTSSLQIEIGKLSSEADQETVLQVLDDGALGKICVREVTECLGNLLEKVNLDIGNNNFPSKKVYFSTSDDTTKTSSTGNPRSLTTSSKSCFSNCNSKETLSQRSVLSQKNPFKKKVSFPEDNSNTKEIFNSNVGPSFEGLDKQCEENQNESLYKLVYTGADPLLPSDSGKIKKSVSFHDSVEFNRKDKEEFIHFLNEKFNPENVSDANSSTLTDTYQSDISHQDSSVHEENSNDSGVDKSLFSDIMSGASLEDSFSYSMQTSNDSITDISECCGLSDSSLLSSNQGELRYSPLCYDLYVKNELGQLFVDRVSNDSALSSGYSGEIEETNDSVSENFPQLFNNNKKEVKRSTPNLFLETIHDQTSEKIKFIKRLLEEALNKKFEVEAVSTTHRNERIEKNQSPLGGIGEKMKLFYDHCREMVDMSKSIELSVALNEEITPNYHDFNLNEELSALCEISGSSNNHEDNKVRSTIGITFPICRTESNINTDSSVPKSGSVKTKNKFLSGLSSSQDVNEEDYMSADSEFSETQVNLMTLPDPSVSYVLNKYIFLDYPPLLE